MSDIRRSFIGASALCAILVAAPLAVGSSVAQSGAPQGSSASSPPALTANTPADFSELARSRLPTVVAVTTRQRIEERVPGTGLDDLPFGEQFRRFFEQNRPEPRQGAPRGALGSGFIIDGDGHIVTNNHVIENANEIRVVFQDRTTRSARLVGRDPATDIAVLKVDDKPAQVPVAQWGNSDQLQPGAWTIAIGSPFGLGGTVTVGVLSARSRDIQAGPYDDFLQTDASINSGNSGGPLFNAQGQVVGVNTAIFSPSGGNVGIGFAVPSNTARPVAEELIRNGRIERGSLGISFQPVTEPIAQALGLQGAGGVLVANVEPGSPAAQAGIRTGDAITRFNNQTLEAGRSLPRLVAEQRAGAQVPLTIVRNGESRQVTITIGQRGSPQTARAQDRQGAQQNQGRRLGVSLAPLDERARQRFNLAPDQQGVVIYQVEPSSPAAEDGLRQNDIILEANNQTVAQPGDVAEQWRRSLSNGRPALFRVKRGDRYVFVAVDDKAG